MSLRVLDLFCGCGGMSWGLHKAGFRTVAGIDTCEDALRTFQLNHKEALAINADLTTFGPKDLLRRLKDISIDGVDCIVGGPPCQGFSKNQPASYRFLGDPQNHLFNDFLSYVRVLEPRAVVIENVAEIYNAYDGHFRNEIVERLDGMGYQTSVRVLYGPDFGIPQRRRRCFFVAARNTAAPSFPEPSHCEGGEETLFGSKARYVTAWSAISDLPVLLNGEGSEPMEYTVAPENAFQVKMREKSVTLYDHVTRKLNRRQFARINSLEAGQGIKDLPKRLRPRSGYSGAYGRLDFEMIAPTITRWVFHPGSGRYCHPKEVRLITMREAARLQSFSDDFRFTGTYIQKAGQIGNAVPPLFMEALAPMLNKVCFVAPTSGRLTRYHASKRSLFGSIFTKTPIKTGKNSA